MYQRQRSVPRNQPAVSAEGSSPEHQPSNASLQESQTAPAEQSGTPLLDLFDCYDRIAAGELQSARADAHVIAEGLRAQGQQQDAVDAAGLIWQVSRAITDTRDALAEEDWTGASDQARKAEALSGDLSAEGWVRPETASRVQAAARGYDTGAQAAAEASQEEAAAAEASQEEAAAAESSQGSGTAAESSQEGTAAASTPIVDQHELPHERNWAFCGIATLIGVLRGEGIDVAASDRDDLVQLSQGIYIRGKGTSGAGIAARMRDRGLKADFTTGGTSRELAATVNAGKAVPLGVLSLSGTVVSIEGGSSSEYPHLRPGDAHARKFGSLGHWVTVVGMEGEEEAPRSWLINDPDSGAQLRLTDDQLRVAAGAIGGGGIWMIRR